MTTRALVLGGGGITGIAWEIGLLHGLIEAGVDLTGADLVLGTSAGSVVGAVVPPRGHGLRAGRGLRWYVRQATGEAKWDEYVESCRARGKEPVSRREFERAREAAKAAGVEDSDEKAMTYLDAVVDDPHRRPHLEHHPAPPRHEPFVGSPKI